MARPKSGSILLQIKEFIPLNTFQELDAIASYRHLPHLPGLGVGYGQALSLLEDSWRNTLFWVAYKMFPCVDVHRSPYLARRLTVTRERGYALWYWLQLCEGCWGESPKYRKFYAGHSPLSVWGLCMREFKQNDAEGIVKGIPGDPLEQGHKNARQFILALLGGDPHAEAPAATLKYVDSPHTDRLIRTALWLKNPRTNKSDQKRRSFVIQYFDPFIEQLRKFADLKQLDYGVCCGVKGEGADAVLVERKGKGERVVKAQDMSLGEILEDAQIAFTIRKEGNKTTVITWVLKNRPSFSNEKVYVNVNSGFLDSG